MPVAGQPAPMTPQAFAPSALSSMQGGTVPGGQPVAGQPLPERALFIFAACECLGHALPALPDHDHQGHNNECPGTAVYQHVKLSADPRSKQDNARPRYGSGHNGDAENPVMQKSSTGVL